MTNTLTNLSKKSQKQEIDIQALLEAEAEAISKAAEIEAALQKAAIEYEKADQAFYLAALSAAGAEDPGYLDAQVARSRCEGKVKFEDARLVAVRAQLNELKAKRIAAAKDGYIQTFRRLGKDRDAKASELANALSAYVSAYYEFVLASQRMQVASPIGELPEEGALATPSHIGRAVECELACLSPTGPELSKFGMPPGANSSPLINRQTIKPFTGVVSASNQYILEKLGQMPQQRFAPEKQQQTSTEAASSQTAEVAKPDRTQMHTAADVMAQLPKQRLSA